MNILQHIERALFGATAEESAAMRLKLIERRIDQHIEQALDRILADDEPDVDEDHDFDGCDFCERRWQFRIRYPRELDGKGTALWLCKPCADDMPLDYRPYVEVERQAAR